MLGTNQLDFMSYATALKSNYRKGIRRLEAILSNPTHAAEFAANLGGVSVVLGVPIGREDRNSDALLSLLLNSDIADDAVLTWMHQFYEFTTWDDLMGNSARVQEMMQNPFLWRALGGSKKAVGKGVATLAGLSCVSYADIDAVVASSTAMTAVATSQTAMTAVAASSTAMTAVATSQTAMTAVATSQTAMTAVATSQTAMTAVATSQTAMTAVIGNATALNAVVSSSTAMTAVAASGKARVAITSSTTALAALASSPLKTSVSTNNYNGSYAQLVSGRACFIISATHNSSGWTFGLRYLYTSETNSEAKTYSSTGKAQTINLFTTSAGLAAFANANSSSEGRITLAYIPC